MPMIKRGGLVGRIAVAAAAMAALALPSGALAGDNPCNLPQTSKVFAQFGDDNNYYLATGGAFEYSLLGLVPQTLAWTGLPEVRWENEPYRLAGKDHRTSIRLRPGVFVAKAGQCVSEDQPHARFVARSLGSGDLVVRVDTLDLRGGLRSKTTVVRAADHATWAPTRFIDLDTSGMRPGETALATITIISRGDWLVDDVFIDPYAR